MDNPAKQAEQKMRAPLKEPGVVGTAVSVDEAAFIPREIPLDGDLHSYVAVLARRAPGTIVFRTGAGRLFRDLLIHWPMVEDWEVEAQELCRRMTDAVYPLVGELYAQGVEMTVTISPTPIEAPTHIDALSTCIIFDTEKRVERTLFLSPNHPLPSADLLGAQKGIVALCRPLHYRYHVLQDDREQMGHPHAGIFELPQRLINELDEQPSFIPREKAIIATLKTKIAELPKKLERDEVSRSANPILQKQPAPSSRPLPVIPILTSLSALPSAISSLERILLSYIMDTSLSPDLRFRLRYISQILRALYPRALIKEAAYAETAHAALKVAPLVAPPVSAVKAQPAQAVPASLKPIPRAFPKATPVAAVGKLGKSVQLMRAPMPHMPRQNAGLRAFPMPAPIFMGTK